MELNRIMAPCTKRALIYAGVLIMSAVSLRSTDVNTGLDDIALNAYQRGTKKFKGYTEGTWELIEARELSRFVILLKPAIKRNDITKIANSPYEASHQPRVL